MAAQKASTTRSAAVPRKALSPDNAGLIQLSSGLKVGRKMISAPVATGSARSAMPCWC